MTFNCNRYWAFLKDSDFATWCQGSASLLLNPGASAAVEAATFISGLSLSLTVPSFSSPIILPYFQNQNCMRMYTLSSLAISKNNSFCNPQILGADVQEIFPRRFCHMIVIIITADSSVPASDHPSKVKVSLFSSSCFL